jgi:hypothetical protein
VLITHLPFGLHCGLLRGLAINTLETDTFQDPWNRYDGKPIGGLTHCWASYVVIGNASVDINQTSYAHEMMYVAECVQNGGDEQHASWGSQDVTDPESKWGAVFRARHPTSRLP